MHNCAHCITNANTSSLGINVGRQTSVFKFVAVFESFEKQNSKNKQHLPECNDLKQERCFPKFVIFENSKKHKKTNEIDSQ